MLFTQSPRRPAFCLSVLAPSSSEPAQDLYAALSPVPDDTLGTALASLASTAAAASGRERFAVRTNDGRLCRTVIDVRAFVTDLLAAGWTLADSHEFIRAPRVSVSLESMTLAIPPAMLFSGQNTPTVVHGLAAMADLTRAILDFETGQRLLEQRRAETQSFAPFVLPGL